jgi:hypothetical protein
MPRAEGSVLNKTAGIANFLYENGIKSFGMNVVKAPFDDGHKRSYVLVNMERQLPPEKIELFRSEVGEILNFEKEEIDEMFETGLLS